MTDSLHDRLHRTIDSGQAPGLHSIIVAGHGRVLLEHHGAGEDHSWLDSLGTVVFNPGTLHDLRSVTKSITALLYGIALSHGQVPDPATPLLRGFPGYPGLAADPRRARLTVEHALTMSLGLEWKEDIPYDNPDNGEIAMELAPDRYRYVLERPVTGPPGVQWAYCGGATALLGHLIAEGTGRRLPEYAHDVLFEPLGIHHFEWLAGPDGVASAASGLRMTARDLATIGEMVLAGGSWAGRQVVPENWLQTMLTPRLTTAWGGRYGYHWYLEESAGHPWAAGMGNGGQRLIIVPGPGLVAVITAGNYDDPEQWRTPVALMDNVILPAAQWQS